MDKCNTHKRTWAEVNLNVIDSNMRALRAQVNPMAKVMAIVKADAYGHGAPEVAETVLNSGADLLGIATVEEGAQLRECHINAPILVLGYTPLWQLDDIIQHKLIQTVFDVNTAQELSRAALGFGCRAPIHIKIDTGMSRLGFFPGDEAVADILRINAMPGIEIQGFLTHFASSGDDAEFTALQYRRFDQFIQMLKQAGVKVANLHVSNSGAVLNRPDMALDIVRTGILLYGLTPSVGIDFRGLSVQPALSWKTQVAHVKMLEPEISVGYGRTFYTQRKTLLAVLPIGYADGYSRRLSNCGRVLIGGSFAPVIGRVCMDQIMVDITGLSNIKPGDEAVLIGRQGDKEITATDLAQIQDTICYEVVCAIGKRVPRVYARF